MPVEQPHAIETLFAFGIAKLPPFPSSSDKPFKNISITPSITMARKSPLFAGLYGCLDEDSSRWQDGASSAQTPDFGMRLEILLLSDELA
jgi:hypothetical protein